MDVDVIKPFVYRALKLQPRVNIDDLRILVNILAGKNIPKDVIVDIVEHEILTGFLDIDEPGKIYIKIVLDPVTEQHAGLWSYDDILATPGMETQDELPNRYINPVIKHLLHRGQGGAGTCTGQSAAYIVDLIYLRNTEDYPSSEDKTRMRRNVRDKNTRYDACYPQSFSAACSYYDGRRIGRVSAPTGGYIDYCLRAAKTEGVCRDWQWACPKDGVVNFIVPYPDIDPENGETCAETKKKHKLDGYATVKKQMDSIKRAVYQEGGVIGGYYMYENLPHLSGTGVFENIGEHVIGAHAVAVVGWTSDGYLVILNSWWDEKWPFLNFVSLRYHTAAGMYFMTAMQKESVLIARDMYVHVIVVTNRAAKIYVDDQLLGETTGGGSVGAELKRGTTHVFNAMCKLSGDAVTKTIKITSDTKYIDLLFEEPEEDDLFEKLQKKFADMVEKFKKIFGNFITRSV